MSADVLGFRVPPVVRSVDVGLPVAEAFDLFTRRIHLWWPTVTHSLGEARTRRVVMDPRVGGRLYEVLDDGTEHAWGAVLTWREPEEVAFTWHVGRPPDTAQTVTVTFSAAPPGTRVVPQARRLGGAGAGCRRAPGELRPRLAHGPGPVRSSERLRRRPWVSTTT